MQVNYAIVFVSDMGRSVEFYRDVLGIPLKFQTPGWTEFATAGSTLALHATREAAAQDDVYERPGRCRWGFAVQDLDAFHRRMVEQGVTCVEPPRELFGARIAMYVDPDGMPFGVSDAHKRS